MIVAHADVRDRAAIAALAETPFAALIVDPPYSEHVHGHAVSSGAVEPCARDFAFAALDDRLRAAIATVAAHATRWSAIFSDVEGTHAWRDAMRDGPRYVRAVPWVRFSQPQISGDRPPSGCEMVSLFHAAGRMAWSGPSALTAFFSPSLRDRGKHGGEKPLDLMLSLVAWFSDAGERVVDPCCGAGTTGQACRLLERDAILLDVDAGAVARTRARLAAPLTPGERARCERWIAYQRAWVAATKSDTASARARVARAIADVARVERALV